MFSIIYMSDYMDLDVESVKFEQDKEIAQTIFLNWCKKVVENEDYQGQVDLNRALDNGCFTLPGSNVAVLLCGEYVVDFLKD